MADTVCIRNIAWTAAFDASRGSHAYLKEADVVFAGNEIVHVGVGYDGPADVVVDGRSSFVMPGLVDVHAHPHTEPSFKGLREDHGVPEHFMSGLYERCQALHVSEEGRRAGAEVAYCELLASGVTSLADLSTPFDGWLDLLAKSGLRAFVGCGFDSARWYMDDQHGLKFEWDEAAGRAGFDAAIALLDESERHPSNRLSGVVYPGKIDTCTEDLLRDSIALAQETKRPITTHIAQSILEFNEMVRRHGKTPIQFAADIGLLAPNAIVGHAIFVDQHSWMHWWSRRDIALIAENGATVAHCPTVFARYGQTLENFGLYRRAGINMALGTDVSPHNMLEEMRNAAILARVSGQDIAAGITAEVFHAATIGGATALGRDDIGRLAPGCKADLVVVDLSDVNMIPVRDPLRSLMYTAAERAVKDVYVDGIKVVSDRKVLTMDRAEAAAGVAEAQARMIEAVPELDYAGRTAEQISPLSLPVN